MVTTPLVVGSASARPGEAAAGWIDVSAGSDAGTRLPVTVVHGARPGPVLALVAGTHGYEYTSMLALQRVRPRLDPGRMAGSVILLHQANPPCFYGRRVYYGPDGKNLNRVYPGAADGTISDRIAHAVTREVIDRCTHLVDMHCGDGNEACRPYAYWVVSGNREVDAGSRELALGYGLDHIVIDHGRPKDAARSLFTSNTAVLRGKPALTTESGGMGLTDEASVGNHERGALSLIAQLGIQDFPSARVARPVWIDRNEVLRAPTTGVWHATVVPMQHLAAGTLVGRLTDPWGTVLHEVRAPFAGIVLYIVATPPVTEGEPLAGLGAVAAREP